MPLGGVGLKRETINLLRIKEFMDNYKDKALVLH